MNFKAIVKNAVPDIATGAGLAFTPKVMSMIPVLNEQPLVKNAVGYVLFKMIGSKLKGVPGAAINGLALGCVSGFISTGLQAAGVNGIESAYIAGNEFIPVEIPSPGVDNAYIAGSNDPFSSEM